MSLQKDNMSVRFWGDMELFVKLHVELIVKVIHDYICFRTSAAKCQKKRVNFTV